MIRQLPAEVQQALTHRLGTLKSFTPASGGCINNGGRLETSGGTVFVKWNDAQKFPGMFESESRGLQILEEADGVRVPGAVFHREAGRYQFITMEWIEPSRRSASYWEKLGSGLATLHQTTSKQFGLAHDNYIGSLPQHNEWLDSWTDFFIHRRIEPQLKMLNASSGLRKKFDALFKSLPDIFPNERPALLHGDLWGGNLITDDKGEPCLIDPAVHFGHREMELSFTRLFGGFDPRFYDTYKGVFPLHAGFEERVAICNLYPLLVHANLFGGHYLREIEDILSPWA
jgi:protein-ribulosamine 3-kinase